ncbi:hypothetical protein L0665_09005 [Methanogenium marinum]|uniref:Uncharacterized protein n=1 Tax=Methanogenium marinum TaxID=348610 RepID=A0A9Q4PYI1_9EURY|nr:hypothetical protein [Methanogenium marinum]MDE4908743.1 hypothetical protein [Methanogenium marinum]
MIYRIFMCVGSILHGNDWFGWGMDEFGFKTVECPVEYPNHSILLSWKGEWNLIFPLERFGDIVFQQRVYTPYT